jgi:hypothetical protein
MPNRGVLAPKGASKRPPSVPPVYKRKGGIYRLIFRVSALPGQLSALDHKRCDRSHSWMNFCI